jgi:hypothetical protein
MTKSQTAEARAVERARIILASLEGKEIQPVGRELKLSVPTISKWRQRFSLWGLRGLRDQHGRENRSGMTPHFATGCWPRWRRHRLPACPIGTDRRWRRNSTPAFTPSGAFCVGQGIYLQRRRSWCVSTDREFAPKAADVVGLYLNPPLNALVLSVDEKPSIQAIERTSGYVETDSGKVVRGLKSTYKRHGTLNLFASRHWPGEDSIYGVQKAGGFSQLPRRRAGRSAAGHRDPPRPR